MNIQGFVFITEQSAKDYYGDRFDNAILAKAIIDKDGNQIGEWE